jgi:hypothetical protein
MAGEDRQYLNWVKGLPCDLRGAHECQGPIDAHHRTGAGMGLRAHDRQSFPLCRRAHRNRHDVVGYFEGWDKARLKSWELDRVAHYQALYLAR